MPDYMLVFAIVVLTHHPEFETHEDVGLLNRMKNALWFVLEPLMTKNDNFSFGFYKALVEKMKHHVDAMQDQDESYNYVRKLKMSNVKQVKLISGFLRNSGPCATSPSR